MTAALPIGLRVTVTRVDFVFRPQPTTFLTMAHVVIRWLSG
ncbi:hypothetical protein [Streptomyces sp. MUM 203J]|nr:hypothetical protein [Streptomyces sp. MUM 203J]